jgi:Phytanoyl-CoA dioxygenase (PhyH)
MVACPSSIPFVFSELLIDIAAAYLGCMPAMGGLNLRKSFVNDLPDMETNHFHCDGNSPRFLKFFLYMNDVDALGGPFCYVAGSHTKKPFDWRRKYHWSREEIESYYGPDAIRLMTGKVGDLIIADTTGFHRGVKVQSAPRRMLTIDYTIHREYWRDAPAAAMPTDAIENFTTKQRAATEFSRLVPVPGHSAAA